MHFRHISCIKNDLVRFIEILSHIGPLTMAAEAPDPHHGGPGCVGEGRNGLTGANIPTSRPKKGFKRNVWRVTRRYLKDYLPPYVQQLPDFVCYKV